MQFYVKSKMSRHHPMDTRRDAGPKCIYSIKEIWIIRTFALSLQKDKNWGLTRQQKFPTLLTHISQAKRKKPTTFVNKQNNL